DHFPGPSSSGRRKDAGQLDRLGLLTGIGTAPTPSADHFAEHLSVMPATDQFLQLFEPRQHLIGLGLPNVPRELNSVAQSLGRDSEPVDLPYRRQSIGRRKRRTPCLPCASYAEANERAKILSRSTTS